MKIYYQGNLGSYMNIASKEIATNIESKEEIKIIGKNEFKEVWEELKNSHDSIAVLAIENSYMGNIHTNLYNFLKYDYKIIGDYYLDINHCICSKETDLKNIKKAYSQTPALEQCHNYLKDKNIEGVSYIDTSLSAKLVSESDKLGVGAICSEEAANIYGLNILERKIQDQKGNTTRFIIVSKKDSDIKYKKPSNKVSIIFEVKHIPSALHKCLGVFAEENINLTKIESIPSYKGPFDYMFFVEMEGNKENSHVEKSIKSLEKYTNFIKIIGDY